MAMATARRPVSGRGARGRGGRRDRGGRVAVDVRAASGTAGAVGGSAGGKTMQGSPESKRAPKVARKVKGISAKVRPPFHGHTHKRRGAARSHTPLPPSLAPPPLRSSSAPPPNPTPSQIHQPAVPAMAVPSRHTRRFHTLPRAGPAPSSARGGPAVPGRRSHRYEPRPVADCQGNEKTRAPSICLLNQLPRQPKREESRAGRGHETPPKHGPGAWKGLPTTCTSVATNASSVQRPGLVQVVIGR